MKRPIGEAALDLYLLRSGSAYLKGSASTFSRLATATSDRSYPRILNSVAAALFNRDYYDYYRQDGWSVGGGAGLGAVSVSGLIEISHHFIPSQVVEHALLVQEDPRALFIGDSIASPYIRLRMYPGLFRIARGELNIGDMGLPIPIDFSGTTHIDARFTGLYGDGNENGQPIKFRSAELGVRVTIPTIPTGYVPMYVRLAVQVGKGSTQLPMQYQFRLPTSSSFMGRFGVFYSAPVGVYGGTDLAAIYAEHNFSDIFWRWLGLPTYHGRGLELIIGGAGGATRNDNPSGYWRTSRSLYGEMGFGIGKIPTFISNVAFLQFDARWGITEVARGNFGMALTLSSPF
jgi:hypothetical protein